MDILDYCKQLQRLLKNQDSSVADIQKALSDLINLLSNMAYLPREYYDEMPTNELMERGLYNETLNLLFVVYEKLETLHNNGDVYRDIGICYYNLKNYDKAMDYFYLAINDDEDYRLDVQDLIDEIEKQK